MGVEAFRRCGGTRFTDGPRFTENDTAGEDNERAAGDYTTHEYHNHVKHDQDPWFASTRLPASAGALLAMAAEGKSMWYCIVALALAGVEPAANDLAPPVRLLAGGQPINVDVGHAAPFVADLKGDGKGVLLVGQFGGGKLRLYPNAGTRSEPRFDKFDWFNAGGTVGSVPAS
jgi:hypothetical protein